MRHILRERGLFFISSSRSQEVTTLAPTCKHVRDPSDQLRVPGLTLNLCAQSKSDHVVITWSPSGYTHVRTDCPDALSSSCLQIKMWQLAKAHGVTRNELKNPCHMLHNNFRWLILADLLKLLYSIASLIS